MLGFVDRRRAATRPASASPAADADPARSGHDVRDFAEGLDEVLVIEEKNPTLGAARQAMPSTTAPIDPRVVGQARRARRTCSCRTTRHARRRRILLGAPPLTLGRRLGDRLRPLDEVISPTANLIPLTVNRAPFYCSGCPHNASTRVEPGTLVGGGIGCHAMVAFMEPERVGDIVGLTCMGGEGAQWIGMAPFVERDHLVQNLGDGTFFHSGSLAVRAAVAAGVDITYKLLLQRHGRDDRRPGCPGPAVGARPIAAMLLARRRAAGDRHERRPDRVDGRSTCPAGVDVWDRSRLDEAQQVLAGIKGVTVLIHDQACAAENRRAREPWHAAPTPGFRVVINERVCEGCGDCGDTSNCLSVQPIDTPYGRKTRDPPDQLQLRLLVPGGRLSVVRHRHGRPERDGHGRGPPRRRRHSTTSRRRRTVVDPDDFTVRLTGHRRHRRGHRQPDPRHGGDARRPARPRARPDRSVAEGRAGRQRRSRSPATTPAAVQPRQRSPASTASWRSTCSSVRATSNLRGRSRVTAPSCRLDRRRARPARW